MMRGEVVSLIPWNGHSGSFGYENLAPGERERGYIDWETGRGERISGIVTNCRLGRRQESRPPLCRPRR